MEFVIGIFTVSVVVLLSAFLVVIYSRHKTKKQRNCINTGAPARPYGPPPPTPGPPLSIKDRLEVEKLRLEINLLKTKDIEKEVERDS